MFMVLVHSYEIFTSSPIPPNIPGFFIIFLGTMPAAPVFMFAMGVGLVYSRKNTPKMLFSRGVILFILGFVLDFFRDFLPQLWLYRVTGDIDQLILGIHWLFGIDVLAFAGFTLMFFAAAMKFNFKNKHYILAAIIFAAANLLLSNINPENYVIKIICGMFWGTNEYTWFPFLTWIAYPIFGYLFGLFLIRCNDKKEFYKTVLFTFLPVYLLFLIYSFVRGIDFSDLGAFFQGAFFHHDFISNIMLIPFVFCWAGLFYFLSPYIPGFVNNTLSRLSKNITSFYCVHWLILGWIQSFFYKIMPLSLSWILLISLAVIITSDFISVHYLKIKSRVIKYKNNEKNK